MIGLCFLAFKMPETRNKEKKILLSVVLLFSSVSLNFRMFLFQLSQSMGRAGFANKESCNLFELRGIDEQILALGRCECKAHAYKHGESSNPC